MEIKPENGGDGKEPTVAELREQIENLNKGIAKYRDTSSSSQKEAQEAKATAAEAAAEVARLKKVIEDSTTKDEGSDDPELQLAPKDQKRLEKWAQENGFVTKAELEKEKNKLYADSLASVESQAVNEFLESHPEYNKDDNWAKIKEQFALYKQPTTIVGYRQLLGRIHTELSNTESKASRVRANEEKLSRLGLGGGSQKDGDSSAAIESLQERYPNLSKELILARLEEINNLSEARKARSGKK